MSYGIIKNNQYERVAGIQKLPPVESGVLQTVLANGETEVSYTHELIDDNSCFDFYADKEHNDLIPADWSVEGHTLTVVYDAQDADVTVGVQVVKGVIING